MEKEEDKTGTTSVDVSHGVETNSTQQSDIAKRNDAILSGCSFRRG